MKPGERGRLPYGATRGAPRERRTESRLVRAMSRMLWLFIVLIASGCINRPGMNLECQWPPDDTYAIDVNNPAHLRHLLSDIEVVDELTIRYRDEMGGRRPRPFLGVQFRTRQSARPPVHWAEQCQKKLIKAIAGHHSIGPETIAAVRPELAKRGFDLPVTIPMLLLSAWLARSAVRRTLERFGEDTRLVRCIALLVASIAVGAAIVIAGTVWSGVVEIIRVGNEHLASRASLIAWPARAGGFFVASSIGVWLFTFATGHHHRAFSQPRRASLRRWFRRPSMRLKRHSGDVR